MNKAVPKVNCLDAACEAACQCIGQDEFADILQDSMRARDLHGVKKIPPKRKKKQLKKKIGVKLLQKNVRMLI